MPKDTDKQFARIRKFARAPHAGKQQEAERLLAELDAKQRTELLLELVVDDEHVARALAADLLAPMISQDDALGGRLMALLDKLMGARAAAPDSTGLESVKLAAGIQAVVLAMRHLPSVHSARTPFESLLDALLDDPDPDVCYAALTALEWFEVDGSPDYIERLVGLLDSRDAEIRIVAAQAIVRLGAEEVLPSIDRAWKKASGVEAFHLLLARAALGAGDCTAPLISMMERGADRFAAIEALAAFGDADAIAPLLSRARAWFGDPLLKVAAARAAAMLGSAEGVTLLQRFAGSKRPEIRGFALTGLADAGVPDIVQTLTAAASNEDDVAAPQAAELLGRYREDDAVQAFLERMAAEPSRPEVAEAATVALSD